MLEHKRTHIAKPQPLSSQDVTAALSNKGESSQDDHLQPPSVQPPLNQSIPGCHSMPPSPDTSSPISPLLNRTFPNAAVDSKEGLNILTMPPECISPPSPAEQDQRWSGDDMSGDDMPDDIFAPEDSSLHGSEDETPEGMSHTVHSNSDHAPKNKTIMKMLATAYMKRFQPVQSSPCKKRVIPKAEIIPLEITSESKSEPTPTNLISSVGHLRHLLTKSSTKSKASAASSQRGGNIVPLTRTFCPVVVLETRQKLIDSNNIATQGSYQCGRCRKVFQDSDSLTVHHATHRKERVKCCRLCKELVIGNSSLPDYHICSQLSDKTSLHSLRNKFTFTKKTSFHHQRAHHFKQQQRGYLHANTRKLFFCPVCKHSYTRRYNLTKHKCLGQPLSHASSSPLHKSSAPGANGKMNSSAEFKLRPPIFNNVSVGTDISRRAIKREAMGTDISPEAHLLGLPWSGSPKSFSPFYPRSSKHATSGNMEESLDLGTVEEDNAAQYKTDQRELSGGVDAAGCSQPGERDGEWTVPLDDETEVLIGAVEADNSEVEHLDDETAVLINAGAVDISHVEREKPKSTVNSHPMPYFIKDGVKRYPCNKCHKTYSRGNTLRRHQRLCGLVRAHIPQAAFGKVLQQAKPMFDCFVCGKSFNRRDNMLVHRRKCQLKRTVGGRDGEHQSFSASKSLSLLGAKRGVSAQEQGDNASNWGIMSLPSVLPRRVTCECGTGFTSPQLLLEHLQKHAQESYTCPTCGETLGSWADYEVHLQVHMQSHHQLYRGVQLQRSQPLLLRFQQKTQPPSLPKQQPGLKKQLHSVQRSLPNQPALPRDGKPQQRSVCIRCNNTFGTRSALLKHLSLNRCKGSQGAAHSKTNQCSRCNADFPNAISLKFHQRSGACKPVFKPMRCPVCVRWFGTVEGLQKHLLTHNQSNSFSCLICQRIYPTMRSLKDHRRKVHKIRAGEMAEITHATIKSV